MWLKKGSEYVAKTIDKRKHLQANRRTVWSGTRTSRVRRSVSPSAGTGKRSKKRSPPILPTSTDNSQPQMGPKQSWRKAWADGSGYSNSRLWYGGPKIGWSVSLSISSIRSSAARWGGVISADIKHWMNESYAYTTVRKVYNIL